MWLQNFRAAKACVISDGVLLGYIYIHRKRVGLVIRGLAGRSECLNKANYSQIVFQLSPGKCIDNRQLGFRALTHTRAFLLRLDGLMTANLHSASPCGLAVL